MSCEYLRDLRRRRLTNICRFARFLHQALSGAADSDKLRLRLERHAVFSVDCGAYTLFVQANIVQTTHLAVWHSVCGRSLSKSMSFFEDVVSRKCEVSVQIPFSTGTEAVLTADGEASETYCASANRDLGTSMQTSSRIDGGALPRGIDAWWCVCRHILNLFGRSARNTKCRPRFISSQCARARTTTNLLRTSFQRRFRLRRNNMLESFRHFLSHMHADCVRPVLRTLPTRTVGQQLAETRRGGIDGHQGTLKRGCREASCKCWLALQVQKRQRMGVASDRSLTHKT